MTRIVIEPGMYRLDTVVDQPYILNKAANSKGCKKIWSVLLETSTLL